MMCRSNLENFKLKIGHSLKAERLLLIQESFLRLASRTTAGRFTLSTKSKQRSFTTRQFTIEPTHLNRNRMNNLSPKIRVLGEGLKYCSPVYITKTKDATVVSVFVLTYF